MKNILSFVLAVLMLLSLTACGIDTGASAPEEDTAQETPLPEASVTDEPAEPVCLGYNGGDIVCDEDGDFICDVNGVPLCDADHYNHHFTNWRNACEACGTLVIVEPDVQLVDDMLYITPGWVEGEEDPRATHYDNIDAIYEVYNADTGELVFSRSRWELLSDEIDYAEGYLADIRGACWAIPVSEITDAKTCNIAVRARSLDENYADSGFVGVNYTAASELEPLGVSIDEEGIMHIDSAIALDYAHTVTRYFVYDVSVPGEIYAVWEPRENTSDLKDMIRIGNMPYPPQNGGYTLQVYQVCWAVDEFRGLLIDGVSSGVVRAFRGNPETVFFPITVEEYEALMPEME